MTRTKSPFALAVDAYLASDTAAIYGYPGGIKESICARVQKPASWFSRVIRSVDRGSCPVRVLAEFLDALHVGSKDADRLLRLAVPRSDL